MLRPVGAVVLAALLLTACGGGEGGADRESSTPAAPATVLPSTPTTVLPTTTTTTTPVVGRRTGVGVRHETFVDPSRPTSGGPSTRTFPVTIWYPTAGDPDAAAVPDAPSDRAVGAHPLVVFVHGYEAAPDDYEELLRRWAAAGYVVAAAAYPGGGDDYSLQFADTSFLITQLLTMAGAPGSHPLAGTVDPRRIAVTGHSNGELIAYGLGFMQCCRDPRVKSVVSLAGNLGNVAGNPIQRDNGTPILHVLGSNDELQPWDAAIQWDRDNLTPPRWSVTVVGGSHASPYQGPSSPYFDGVVTITTDFLDGTLKGHPEQLTAIDDYIAAHPLLFRVER